MKPDRRHLHEKAMQAAISVTLALGVACAPKPQPFEGSGPEGNVDAADPDDSSDSADPGGGADTAATSDTGDTGAPGADLGDCLGIADMTELAACCEALAAACDAAYPDDWEAAYDCAWGGATGCTPWGPAVPPVA